ncbi:MAG: hypothetical protein EXQ94_13465 [Alphaproteobacteria bacterium]|nr:hypothetical protein [Alphaproteobacteria bacterium]
MTPAYPQPGVDLDNARFIIAWRERGRLVLQRCRGCGAMIFYPRTMCPGCWSPDLAWVEASGRGVVVSYALVHRPNHESFNGEVPIILAEIALAEGPMMIARIIANNPATIRTGLSVKLVSDVGRYPLPTFTT